MTPKPACEEIWDFVTTPFSGGRASFKLIATSLILLVLILLAEPAKTY